ncbi:MAG: GyrI-like domain-containing protein [Planctomycetota bacterium JB042]
MLDVEVRSLDPVRVAAIRHTGPYVDLGPCFERIMGWAFGKGIVGPGTRCLGLYHDNPREVPAERLRSAACVSVGPDVAADPSAGVEVIEVEGGEYAVATHVGPYTQLEAAYDELFGRWLPGSGRTLRDLPCYEVYLNDPRETKPEELRTAIHLPLA